jgi:lysophospholipase L1-like esterase
MLQIRRSSADLKHFLFFNKNLDIFKANVNIFYHVEDINNILYYYVKDKFCRKGENIVKTKERHMRKKHIYNIREYVKKDIWHDEHIPNRCIQGLISKTSLYGYILFVFLLLVSPISHLQAGNLSTVPSYQTFLMVQTSTKYLKILSLNMSSIKIESIRSAILDAAKNQAPSDQALSKTYIPVSRPPQKEAVADPSFFTDAAFLGDSITEALIINSPTDEATVLAAKGMTINKALTFVPQLISAAPNKVYILLGINDIANYNAPIDRHITSYRTLLTTLMKDLPHSTLYVQSVFPLAKHYNNTINKLTNEKVEQFNEKLAQLCQELGLRYIDVFQSFKDESGYMITALSSDGLHLKASYYPFWLNLLMENSN